MPHDPIIGIDLGTTNSVVSTCDDEGEPRVLPDDKDERIHPSVVSFHPNGKVMVGASAKQRRVIDPRNTISSVKRLIGRTFDSPEVATSASRMPFELREGPGRMPTVVTRAGEFSIPEISALVLNYMRTIAQRAVRADAARAVVTVPANFTDAQRAATASAGEIAGIQVVRVLNEPTAAALAYGHRKRLDKLIAVYDFGGGTFDVSVLQLRDEIYEVLGTAGDTFLGGDDIDEALVEHMLGKFLAQHRLDLRDNYVALQRLRSVAEQIKIQLSRRTRAIVRIDELAYGSGGAALDLQLELNRDELIELAKPIIRRTDPVCDEALAVAGVRAADITDVVLVGGTTKIPYVRNRASRYFGRAARADVNPDEAVAIGAALQARALSALLDGEETQTAMRASDWDEDTRVRRERLKQLQASERMQSSSVVLGEDTVPGDAKLPSLQTDKGMALGRIKMRRQIAVGEAKPRQRAAVSKHPTLEAETQDTEVVDVGLGGLPGHEGVPSHVPAAGTQPLDLPVLPPGKRQPDERTQVQAKRPGKVPSIPVPLPPADAGNDEPTVIGEAMVDTGWEIAAVEEIEQTRSEVPAPTPAADADADVEPTVTEPGMSGTAPSLPPPVPPRGITLPPPLTTPPPILRSERGEAAKLRSTMKGPPVEGKPVPKPPPIKPPVVAPPIPAPAGQPPHLRSTISTPPPVAPTPRAPAAKPTPIMARGIGQKPGALPPAHTPPASSPPMRSTDRAPVAPPPVAAGKGEGLRSLYEGLNFDSDEPTGSTPLTELRAQAPKGEAPPAPLVQSPPPAQPPIPLPEPEPDLQLAIEARTLIERESMPPPIAPVIVDVTPRSLGIATVAGYCEPIVARNTRVPHERQRVFVTSTDNQTQVTIRVCQGESRRFAENAVMGELHLVELAPRPRGETRIEVNFHVDENGMLNVRAVDSETGQEQRVALAIVGAQSPADVESARERFRGLVE